MDTSAKARPSTTGLSVCVDSDGLLASAKQVADFAQESDIFWIRDIDDFGTGYSNLNRLKLFPLDTLKIDKSFVQQIGVDPDYAAIVEAVVRLAHSLKLKVVAEGVETAQQENFLRAHGCDDYQGHFFCPALPASALEKRLAAVIKLSQRS